MTLMSLSFLLLGAHQIFAETCPCGFDTTEYSAVAEGEGYCGSVTKKEKHCTISFNGKVEESATSIEPSSIYGPLNQYVAQVKEVNAELYKPPPYLLAAQDPGWLMKNLPLMIRSSYAAAMFLSHNERENLDLILNNFFKKHGREVHGALVGSKERLLKDNFEVTKGRIKFSADDIVVIFAIYISERF